MPSRYSGGFGKAINVSLLYTYNASFKILDPFLAQNVCDEPAKCGSVLPQVVEQKEGLLCDPHFLDTIGNSHQH